MELKDKLVSLRKGKGLSQLELAEALNVSRQAVSRWEVGTSVPTMEKLIALSKLYDIPLDELIHQKEEQENTVQALEQNEKEEKKRKVKNSRTYIKSTIILERVLIVSV